MFSLLYSSASAPSAFAICIHLEAVESVAPVKPVRPVHARDTTPRIGIYLSQWSGLVETVQGSITSAAAIRPTACSRQSAPFTFEACAHQGRRPSPLYSTWPRLQAFTRSFNCQRQGTFLPLVSSLTPSATCMTMSDVVIAGHERSVGRG